MQTNLPCRTILTLRQMIEGMPLAFNRQAAAGLKAVIQFNMSGLEPGIYHLVIDSGDCTFHSGRASKPTLTINAPSEVWLQIARRRVVRSGCYSQRAVQSGR